MPYDHISLEKKWQKFWNDNNIFETKNPPFTLGKPKKYILDMFPYPSGAGLHVGHPKGYTATDILSRYYHAKGFNVLHPMGFDAFGLPAENYAVKTGTHPAITTRANIGVFTEQLRALGFSYDWDRMVDTTDPEYYKWTQWIFLELFKKGLAYEAEMPVNWCPALKAVLANEEVVDGKSEIGGHPVEKKLLRQWVLRITEYADRLITDLDGLDWPDGIKEMQRNWIGKSEGCEFRLMKKQESKPVALILHGWGGNSQNGWKPWLKNELEKMGYDVILPDLPNTWEPNLEEQLNFLSKYKDRLNQESIIIGHSIGALLACHFVTRNQLDIQKIFCIGPVYDGLGEKVDWTSVERGGNELQSFISQRVDTRTYSSKIVAFLSDNDPYIKYPYAINYFGSIGAEIRTFHDKGHFNEETGVVTLPELLEELSHIRVYTTRVDTVYGMTYVVMAPDHPKVQDFITPEYRAICETYITEAKGKSDQDRTNEGKEKTGVFTGSYVVNPYSGELVPVWIADYVLGTYGTGAVMAVPAHDERDWEFAKKYDLPIRQSIAQKLIGTGVLTPREGVETVERLFVNAIIEHDGRFLLLKEEHGYKFVGGGVDEGEDEIAAFRREVIEETGYDDFEVTDFVINSAYYGLAYRNPKNINQTGYDFPFAHIKLRSLHNIGISDREKAIHSVEWVDRERVAELLVGNGHEQAWNMFLNPRPTTDDGVLMDSGEYTKLDSASARKLLCEKAESEGFGHKKVNYKLRDWLFSRQRYWGEPIPLIHITNEDFEALPRVNDPSEATDQKLAYIYDKRGTDKRCKNCTCGDVGCVKLIIGGKTFSRVYEGLTGKLVIDSRLPLVLPEVEKYEPSGDGQSPLANVIDWVNIELASNLVGKRETNTMPQWGGSCWYYLRYMDNKNNDVFAGQEALKYWNNVDEYIGGAEHAVLHLLYARFWHKVLYDIGVVPTLEPFQKLTNVGLILGPDGQKMSKSRGNVINPNDVVAEHGADTLRLYEMSMGGFTDPAPWNTEAIIGVRRFLDKAYATCTEKKNLAKDDMKAMKLLHKTVKKVGEDIVAYKFNTAISALMILLNEGIPADLEFQEEWIEKFTTLLHPFAPHMAEELWNVLGKKDSVYTANWPEYDDFMLVDDEVTIAVQVNGKLRGTLTCLNGVMQEEVSALAHEVPDIMKWIDGKILVKEIYIPNKLLSIVVKDA